MKIRDYALSLDLGLDETTRVDCPSCGRANTFTVTKTLQGMMWNCYSVNCNTKGVDKDVRFSGEDIKASLNRKKSTAAFSIPYTWVKATTDNRVIPYLKANNCLSAYLDKRVDVCYDVKNDRRVFIIWDQGICKGAIGRKTNHKRYGSKWQIYSDTMVAPLVVPQFGEAGFPHYPGKRVGVIVEDAASACAASFVGDGIALLGTNLFPEYIPLLAKYDHIVVALDPDAAWKGIEMAHYLGFYTSTRVALIPDDLKYMSVEHIKETVGWK